MPFWTHDRIKFHYRDEGAGIPFFFQHGLGGDVSQPFGLFAPPAGFRLIAFDARAHGQTRPVGDPEKIVFATLADDLLALMNHLKIRRAIVGGISMGAGLTLNFTLRWPERVLGLVLSRPAWLDAPNPWNVEMFSHIARLLRQHGARRGQELFKQTDAYKATLRRWPDVANSLALQFEHPRAEETAFKLDRIIRDSPNRYRRAWASIKAPTLVLANRHDPIHPYEYGRILARAIPGATFKEITAKSISLDRHGAEVQQHLQEFLLGRFRAKPAQTADVRVGEFKK
jgi:pimeloyl-ACP methyl ester carboxylesterase